MTALLVGDYVRLANDPDHVTTYTVARVGKDIVTLYERVSPTDDRPGVHLVTSLTKAVLVCPVCGHDADDRGYCTNPDLLEPVDCHNYGWDD